MRLCAHRRYHSSSIRFLGVHDGVKDCIYRSLNDTPHISWRVYAYCCMFAAISEGLGKKLGGDHTAKISIPL